MALPANRGGGDQDGDIQSLADFGSWCKEMRKLLGGIEKVPTNIFGGEELLIWGTGMPC